VDKTPANEVRDGGKKTFPDKSSVKVKNSGSQRLAPK
jgi:hypothetical protein